ncbi:MAG: hypothetical protein B6I37_00030 [Desulfobacteraceae bacterium 4572_35.2]|nr:MAG: hypothetical protein B6I37_00030 [Desulfobacteraceae bacterium 4572_35.2]
MSTIPILLKKPNILVLGGGVVARQKATALYGNRIKFAMIALSYCSGFNQFDVTKITKNIELNDFDQYNIIVDATGCDEVGELLQEVMRKRYVLVNRVDRPEQSNFYFSSLLRYGSLKVAVSTDGASPTIGQIVRDKIDAILPVGLANLVEEVKRQRQQGHIDPSLARKQLLTLFAHVFFIECDNIAEELTTLLKYPQLSKFRFILYQHNGLFSVFSNDSCQHEIEYESLDNQNDCFDCEKAYVTLKSYCQQGETIAVLIRSGEHFLQQSEKLSEYLKNDGVKVEIIVKR